MAGVFIARGKEDALVTKNLVPGESVYGEKRISVEVSRTKKKKNVKTYSRCGPLEDPSRAMVEYSIEMSNGVLLVRVHFIFSFSLHPMMLCATVEYCIPECDRIRRFQHTRY